MAKRSESEGIIAQGDFGLGGRFASVRNSLTRGKRRKTEFPAFELLPTPFVLFPMRAAQHLYKVSLSARISPPTPRLSFSFRDMSSSLPFKRLVPETELAILSVIRACHL